MNKLLKTLAVLSLGLTAFLLGSCAEMGEAGGGTGSITVQFKDADGENTVRRVFSFDEEGRLEEFAGYGTENEKGTYNAYSWVGDQITRVQTYWLMEDVWTLMTNYTFEEDATDSAVINRYSWVDGTDTKDRAFRVYNGKMTLSSTFVGNTATGYTYNWSGDNLTSITRSGSAWMTFTYNADGTVREAVDPYFKKTYTYSDGKLSSFEVRSVSTNALQQTAELSYEGEVTIDLLDISADFIYGYSFYRNGMFLY